MVSARTGFNERRRRPAENHRRLPKIMVLAVCSAMGFGLASNILQAADWKPTASLSLSSTISDNPLLRPRGQEESDVVFRTSPSIGLNHEGSRLKLRGVYSPSIVGYLNESVPETLYNSLTTQASLEAIEDFAFIEAKAAIAQTFLSPFGAQPSDVGTATSNRTESRTLGLSPYVKGRLGSGWQYGLRDDYLVTTYTSGAAARLATNKVSGSIGGDPRTFLVPSADYFYSTTQVGSVSAYTSQEARLRLTANFAKSFNLFVSAGHESNDFLANSVSRPTYGAGATWRPTTRTNVSVTVDKRYFGTGFNLNASHRTRLTTWSIQALRQEQVAQQLTQSTGYVSTRDLLSNLLVSSIPDQTQRDAEVSRLMQQGGFPETLSVNSAYLSPRVMLVESIEPSVAISGARNTLVMSVYRRQTSPLSDSPGGSSTDVFSNVSRITQQGWTVTWSHTITARTSVSAGFDRFRSRSSRSSIGTATDLETTQRALRLTANHQVSKNTAVSAGIRILTIGSNAVSDSRERAALLTLSHQFF
ncbi:MAG: TIGR03016 family PEP-CTERM system-associated outer membrane protein [Betaproteobacteria bacterium]|nr:TIGR03016 family PEP-CTERM system-associated outer membrane protein [Betaproteobacteria bacterium]